MSTTKGFSREAAKVIEESLSLSSLEKVSSGSLLGCLTNINSTLQHAKTQMYETVNHKNKEYVRAFKFTIELREQVADLATEINTISKTVKGSGNCDGGILSGVNDKDSEYNELKEQLRRMEILQNVLELLSRIHDRLSDFDNNLDCGEYGAAANCVYAMEEDLRQIPTENVEPYGCDASIFAVIREQCSRKRHLLKSRVEQLFDQAVNIGSCEIRVMSRIVCNLSKNPVDFVKVIGALNVMDWLESKLRIVAGAVKLHILEPILRRLRTKVIVKCEESHASLCVVEDSSAPTTIVPSILYEKLSTVVTFLFNDVFDNDDDIMCKLGDLLWDDLSRAIIEDCLGKSVPEDVEGLRNYGIIAKETEKFEYRLMESGFLPLDVKTLTLFVTDIDHHFAEKKRERLLTQARKLMLKQDQNTVMVSEGNRGGLSALIPHAVNNQDANDSTDLPSLFSDDMSGFFRLPNFHITQRTQLIVEMSYQTLEQACECSPSVALTLYQSVREVYDLFRAVMITKHGSQFDDVPQRAMLFYNDCFYIAHHLTTMGPQFKDKFQPPLNQTATFIDMVPVFRSLGERVFVDQLTRQKDVVLSIIDTAEGFNEASNDGRNRKIERSITQVLHLITNLSASWREILAEETFFNAIGCVISSAMARMIDELSSVKDLTADDSHQLHTVLNSMSQIRQFFIRKRDKSLSSDCVDDVSLIFKWIPHWNRFLQVVRVLDMSLSDLITAHANGEMSDVEPNLMRSLVESSYCENDRRASFLQKLLKY